MTTQNCDYLVIGAGVAGLALAGDLRKTGATVICVDKGRMVGGRLSTRTLASGTLVDYGAQYFTARGERFQKWVDSWLAEEKTDLRVWNRGYPTWVDGKIREREPGHPRYAPASGMQTVGERLARGVDVRVSTTITGLTKTGDTWTATGHAHPGETPVSFAAKHVCLTLPAEQLLRLAGDFLPADIKGRVETVRYDPAWTLVAVIDKDISLPFTAVEFKNHPVLGWLSRDNTKRDFLHPEPVLVAHASGNWSRVHIEDWKDSVQSSIFAAIEDVCGEKITLLEGHTHRWRYAAPTATAGELFLSDKAAGLHVCGDGCGGVRMENALTTGWLLAASLTRR